MEKVKYVRERNLDSFRLKYAVTRTERLELVAEVGVHGLVLFEYYLRLASIEDAKISDANAADYFGWNEHTARRYRRALINKGWLHVKTAKLDDSTKIIVYYLGKRYVQEANKSKG